MFAGFSDRHFESAEGVFHVRGKKWFFHRYSLRSWRE